MSFLNIGNSSATEKLRKIKKITSVYESDDDGNDDPFAFLEEPKKKGKRTLREDQMSYLEEI
jgi:hypothetical protein